MSGLERIFVKPSTPIMKVIGIIERSASKIALVVNEKGRLCGTITDGDIRRGILRGVTFNDPSERIMNRCPRVARAGEPRERILQRMKGKMLHQMPILDPEGRVVGLEVIHDLLQPSSRSNWVVLMVGGLGMRLRPLTAEMPKPLLTVGTKPILETILENLKEHGFSKFYMAVNYKNGMVRGYFGGGARWGVQIRYLRESKKLGTAGALSLLPSLPSEPIFVMNGDLLTKVDFGQLLHFHRQNKVDATMCVREYDLQVPYGVVRISRHRVLGVDEKPLHRFFVNAGIYVLEPSVIKRLPKDRPCDMPWLFEKLVKAKRRVAAFPIREYWLDVGGLDDLERARGDFKTVFR